MVSLVKFTVLAALFALCNANAWQDAEETVDFWDTEAQQELQDALNEETFNVNVAKNIIMFLGDGMGIPSVSAGRILKGQMHGNSGEETESAMDSFEHTGFSKTYAVNKDGTDSAASATAYLCGVKANYNTIGVSAVVERKDCQSFERGDNNVQSILIDAANAGKSTGIVTTTRINHASPAGTYGHTPYRSWYDDADMDKDDVFFGCQDLAQQFYDNSDKITVAMGGGREYFRPEGTYDPEYGRQVQNNREDGQDLVAMWESKYGSSAKYVWNQKQFDAVDPATTDKLWGMFEPGDMNFEIDRNNPNYEHSGEPSITEMTEKALKILEKNENGYFLFVEGGRIDHGHHGAEAYASLNDWVAFDNAIQKALDMTDESETLIIVTADHSHTFSFGGNAPRGNPIFGLSDHIAKDNKPFSTLKYGSGGGWQSDGDGYSSGIEMVRPQKRADLSDVDLAQHGKQQQSAIPLSSEDHGAEDVMIFAKGPMSHLIHKTHEQSYIPYMMRYAACIGTDLRHCQGTRQSRMMPVGNDTDNTPHVTMPDVDSTTGPSMVVDSIDVHFFGVDLDATQTEYALYIQFILCFVLFFTSINSIILVKKSGKEARKKAAMSSNASKYREFQNEHL